jgi:hypothetical protein
VCFRAVGEDNGKNDDDSDSSTPGRDRFEIEFFEFTDGGTPNDPSDDTCGAPAGGDSGTVEEGEIKYERDD